jgi:WD40 repeat protein
MGSAGEVRVYATTERRIDQAAMLIVLHVGGPMPIVQDAATGEFVVAAWRPTRSDDRPLALAPDGRSLLILADYNQRRYGGLCIHSLATDQQRWFDMEADIRVVRAAFSPDGGQIATIDIDIASDTVFVDVLDVTGKQRRRLWSTSGGWSSETRISFSPDGRFVAATYLQPDNTVASVVIDTSGESVRQHNYMGLPVASNGAWLSDGRVVLLNERDMQLVAVSVVEESSEVLCAPDRGPLAIAADRILRIGPWTGSEFVTLVTTDLHDTDEQTFLTIRPPTHIDYADIARQVELVQPEQR